MEEPTAATAKEEQPSLFERLQNDPPEFVKYLLLLLLLILIAAEAASGEFAGLQEGDTWAWILLIVKLILLAGLIGLIRLQRQLTCEITAPTGCTEETPDRSAGNLTVEVKGTARGSAFGHYELEVREAGTTSVISGIVSYPGGTGSGGSPVVNGTLGTIDTTGLMDGSYEITLLVHPSGQGNPKKCTTTFTLLKTLVYISKAGTVSVRPNAFDPAAELEQGGDLVSIGGRISLEGAAYVYGCPGRKIKDYEIRWAEVTSPGSEPGQPARDAAIPSDWPTSQRVMSLEYTSPDHYKPWTRVGPAPRDLVNSWTTQTIGSRTIHKLQDGRWNSHDAGSGRFTLLLTARDDTSGPHRYHDIQHIWIDNEHITAQITGIKELAPCADLRLSEFDGSPITIEGLAWDPLIDDTFPDTSPNDNFDRYELKIVKQGGGNHPITTAHTRVPSRKTGARPGTGEAGSLATFDITAELDAGRSSSDPAVDLPRGSGCAYYLHLQAWDTTRVGDGGGVHHARSIWPICIVNDVES